MKGFGIVTKEYGRIGQGKGVHAAVIGGVTPRGVNTRSILLHGDQGIGLSVVVDGKWCSPQFLDMSAYGRREIKDLIDLLEWAAKALREDLTEEQLESHTSGENVTLHPAVAERWQQILTEHMQQMGERD